MRIFSNVANATIPTIATGVLNTNTGHCEKTIKILRLVEDELDTNKSLSNQINWLVLADDDTLLSVYQLAKHLSCYQPDADLYLGERYGYMLLDDVQSYNYITGGGGLVLSRSTLSKLAASCQCPSISSPDDMILAACLSQFGVTATHSPLFHQARPIDYPPAAIDSNTISFHKYWQIDPLAVYRQWFKAADDNLHRIKNRSNQRHQSATDDDESAGNEYDCKVYDDGGGGGGVGVGRCDNQIIKRSDYELNHTDL